jgi:chlorobactene glucosyltransferase
MGTLLLSLVPWALFVLWMPVLLRQRPRIAAYAPPSGDAAPLVSVIVPARNEAHNIAECLATLLDSAYPRREIIVVDDGSVDGTGDIARALAERTDGAVRVIDGAPLPPGWFGKPWACWQGYRAARGDVLLFVDADTRQGPELIGHAVGALETERADLVTVLPRQRLRTFWERAVMPQLLLTIMMRYPSANWVNRARRPRDVIANGQFIMVRRSAYEEVGGHEAVRHEVAEDLRLAQRFVASGKKLFLAHAPELMETRMYRSLGEIIEGWTKNVAIGSRQVVEPWLAPLAPWLIAAALLLFWCAPPAVLVASAFGAVGSRAAAWAAGATALSIVGWAIVYARLRVRPTNAVLYALGAMVAVWIFVRSALRGGRVRWKGREYRVEEEGALLRR